MKDRQPLVHRAMFGPSSEGQMRFAGLMQKLGGEAHREIVVGIEHGVFTRDDVPEDLRDRLNTNFDNALKDKLPLPTDLNTRRFWRGMERSAIGVHAYIESRFPSLRIGMLSEVATPIGDVSDTIATLAQEGHASLAGHERKRRLLLGLVSAQIEADDMTTDLEVEIGRVGRALRQGFFVSGDTTRLYKVHSYHDQLTNSVVQPIGDAELGSFSLPVGAVAKSFCFPVRDVHGDGAVYYDANIKPRESAIAKSVDRAAKPGHGGYVRPDEDVTDKFRLIIVRMEPKTTTEQMDIKLREVLNQNYRPLVSAKLDHDTDGYKNAQLGWHRAIYEFDGVSKTLEAVIYDIDGWLNYLHQVGTKNSKTGIYDGLSRDLYDVLRLEGMLKTGYPQEAGLYRIDPQQAVADRMEELVATIRKRGLPKRRSKVVRVK